MFPKPLFSFQIPIFLLLKSRANKKPAFETEAGFFIQYCFKT